MLLAHSKTTAHCEPITVILAEMEAPELAALLGFVYTGSATVPRMRLDAFLRAAEALRIRLPPVPVVMTSDRGSDQIAADCKLEDTKDVKVSSRYLRCDQYPWYQSVSGKTYEDLLDRKESRDGTQSTNGNGENVIRHVGDASRENGNPAGGSCFNTGCPDTWSVGNRYPHRDRVTDDPSAEKDRGSMTFAADEGRSPAMGGFPDSEALPFNAYQQGGTCLASAPHLEEYAGSPDPLERIRMGYERLRVNNNTAERPIDEDVYAAGVFRGKPRDECPYESPRIPVTPSSSPSPSSSSLHGAAVGRARSFDHASQQPATTGEDLSCGESCCRWRTARRHVANRVTASPWRQIVRPHHSPRTPRPHVLVSPRHADDVSTIRQSTKTALVSSRFRVIEADISRGLLQDPFSAPRLPRSACEISRYIRTRDISVESD